MFTVVGVIQKIKIEYNNFNKLNKLFILKRIQI